VRRSEDGDDLAGGREWGWDLCGYASAGGDVSYDGFLEKKSQLGTASGFKTLWMPPKAFDFQASLIDWSVHRGRSAIFADCGLGKTLMLLAWAENVVRHTNRPVLVLSPIAVSFQTAEEAAKFDMEATRTGDGTVHAGINITNYERLNYYDPNDFVAVVCDESSILKSFDGTRRLQITEFMKRVQYRLLDTATAAPNDYIELGTSSEALGELGYTDMLTRYFKNDQNTIKPMRFSRDRDARSQLDDSAKWRFKGHAEQEFWRWVCSWARAIRKPSDLGFSDDKFILPALTEHEHIAETNSIPEGMLFSTPAVGLKEQREERRRTINERSEMAAALVADTGQPALMWCHLNAEGDRLGEIVKDGIQIGGKDSDDAKEEKFKAFTSGQARVLITKPKIGAWGLNFQHCAHVTTFPSHSFEQYYQGVRRCWRFGQTRPVVVDIVSTEGEQSVLMNLQRKAKAADKMFASLVEHMNNAINVSRGVAFTKKEEVPSWL
jgi:hypothetical protein